MEAALFTAILGGALRDPLLWILGAVIGWNQRRALRMTVSYLFTAGGVWGAIRVSVYLGYGESMGLPVAAVMMAVSISLMIGLGLAVREARWLIDKA